MENKELKTGMSDVALTCILDLYKCKKTALDHLRKRSNTRQQLSKIKNKLAEIWEIEFQGVDKSKN